MDNIIPSALQRLRAADIIRIAGLTVASQGQEYCRNGAVRSTQRLGARIIGVVNGLYATSDVAVTRVKDVTIYPVEVEIQSLTSWQSTCACSPNSSHLCPHAAALLYYWLARPTNFVVSTSSVPVSKRNESGLETSQPHMLGRPFAVPLVVRQSTVPLADFAAILAQLKLSDLRNITHEYDIATNGMSKQQLVDALLEALRQPEAVRRVAATLEKSQRQLLAALTLAGGAVTDDTLRGLFARFALGEPPQLQGVLQTLQGKGLLFHTRLSSSSEQRLALSSPLLDVGWYVPMEVRSALRVAVPITVYDVDDDRNTIHTAAPYSLLADLLLVARAVEGCRLEQHNLRPPTSLATNGSMVIPPPADPPSTELLAALRAAIPRCSPALLHFAFRLLRLADIVHKDDSGTPYLRVLPNIAELLLGPNCTDVMHDLFELWLTQSSYDELFGLQKDGLRLCCHATSLNLAILSPGELEAENSEARQFLIALLAQTPLHQWINFKAFARFVYRTDPLFLQKRQQHFSMPHWWLEQEEGRPLRPSQLNDWLRAEFYYLAHFLCGPLHWWGACDLACSRDGRLLAFRLTSIAGWLVSGLTASKNLVADHPDSLEVMENGSLLVTCQNWELIRVIERFAEVAGVHEGRLCYRLTPKVLGDAMSQGHHPTDLLNLLRSTLTNNVEHDGLLSAPSRLLAQLERWIASYGCVRIYTGVDLLQTADTAVMRELSTTTSLGEHIVQTLHPTLHILKKSGTQRLIDDLKRRGKPPLLHDEEYYGAE